MSRKIFSVCLAESDPKTCTSSRFPSKCRDPGGAVNSTSVATTTRAHSEGCPWNCMAKEQVMLCFRYHTGPLQFIPMMLRGFYGVNLTKMEVGLLSTFRFVGKIVCFVGGHGCEHYWLGHNDD